MPLPSTLEVEVSVSWDGTGTFDGEFDDVTPDIDSETGITLSMWRDGAQQLSPPKIADGDFDLLNEDGFYSQDRADSGIYQRVMPSKPVRYRATHGEDVDYRDPEVGYRDPEVYYRGVGYFTLGRHVISDLDPNTDIGDQRVRVETLGYEVALTRTKVTIPVMLNPLVSDCFTAYLDKINWPASKRRIATSDTRLLLYYADERYPWDGMLELLGAEGPGWFGIERDGTFVFENRNYRSTEPRCTTPQASFWDRVFGAEVGYRDPDVGYRDDVLYRGQTSGLWFTRLKPTNPYRSLYNRATYATRRRELGSLAPIWELGADLTLSASQSRTLIIKPSDPFLDAVTPSTGGGDFTVTGGTVSVSLSASSGLTAFLTIAATSGTPTVHDLRLRAKPLAVVGETVVENTVDTSASIAAFSPIPGEDIPLPYTVQGWPEIDIPNAEAVCDSWVLRYQVPRTQVSIALRNGDGALLSEILQRRHSDRITLIEANSGINADFWINSGVLRILDAGGRTVILELGCEMTDNLIGAEWNEDEWDDLSALWGF